MKKLKELLIKSNRFIKNIFIPENLEIQDGIIVSPPRPVMPYVVISFTIVTYLAVRATDFSLVLLFQKLFGIGYGSYEYPPLTAWSYLTTYYFPIDYGYWTEVLTPLLETIQMSFLGSFVGAALALPASFFASSNITKNKYLLVSSRFVLSIFRTLPIIIYASLFVLALGTGAFAGTLAIAVFTFSIVAKMLFEKIETIDLGAYEAIQSTGASRAKSFVTAVLPQILPSYYSMSLYSFEINIRYAAVLGYVGAGGIGLLLKNNMADLNLNNRVFTMLFFIWILVIIIETISRQLRRRLA
ncbi:MAG: phosphonate ABC transporter, permease protein PhnE [Firmicutes bacterium]|nr:phosphonate ABC transporter, permease protein PhnE [Bacillota bacterium]